MNDNTPIETEAQEVVTARTLFRRMIRERRAYPAFSPDWQYRTNAARKFLNILRGVPTTEWVQQ